MTLESKRQDVAQSLDRFREAADRELGWFPKGSGWLLAVTAFAVGLRFAAKKKRRGVASDREEAFE